MSAQLKRVAWGHGYFFFAVGVLLDAAALLDVVIGVVGSVLMVAEVDDADIGGRDVVVLADVGG